MNSLAGNRSGQYPHTDEARVDVVIPAYNAAATIGEAIASLQAQTFAAFRIVVIDDGSTDRTGAVVDRLRASDPRIAMIRQPNGGIVEARNAGLLAATAEYVAIQDADDRSEPDRLEKEVHYLDTHPQCVAVSGSARHIDMDGAATGGMSVMPPVDTADPSWVPAREPYLMPFGLIRRDALDAVGGYRHVDFAEDTDLYWRLRSVGDLANLPDVVGCYRYHSASATGGASLVDTRVLAANNQLAALSSARRERGRPDIPFDKARLRRYRNARSLAQIVDLASADLAPDETTRFKAACAAKMLQWIEGRHLRPDMDDCRFIRQAYEGRPPLAPGNRRELQRLFAVVGARLLRRGEIGKARALLPPAFLPEVWARTALGRC